MDAKATLAGERYYYRFEEIDELTTVEENGLQDKNCSIPSLENYDDRQVARRNKFDWLMGVILPMVCFYFDPIVFRGDLDGGGLLSDYKLPAYVLAFSAIMAQSAWLLWGERLGGLRIVVGLVLLAATVSALLIGLILFPFSLIGMIFLIGFLGLTPFFSAMVYWRSARKALGETA